MVIKQDTFLTLFAKHNQEFSRKAGYNRAKGIIFSLEKNQEKYNTEKISDTLTQHANVINEQGKQIGLKRQLHKKDNARLLKLINLYSDLAACGVMDGKRKENLKAEITNLLNEP